MALFVIRYGGKTKEFNAISPLQPDILLQNHDTILTNLRVCDTIDTVIFLLKEEQRIPLYTNDILDCKTNRRKMGRF